VIVGRLRFTGGARALALTTAVGFEFAFVWPAVFRAKTLIRIVDPASAEERTYVVEVWPVTVAHATPDALQRRQ
jgi:hypothetical protein